MKRLERPFQGIVIQIMHEILNEEKELPFEPYILQERDSYDIALTHKKKQKDICIIELKDPIAPEGSTPYHHKLIAQANKYASSLGCKYMVTWNMQDAVIWDRTDASVPIYDSDIKSFQIFEPMEIDFFKDSNFRSTIHLARLKKFIIELLVFLFERIKRKPLPLIPLDLKYIDRLTSLTNGFLLPISIAVLDKYKRDKIFKRKIHKWINLQLWTWEGTPQTILQETVRLTRISLLYLLNKLIFYLCMYSTGAWSFLPRLILQKGIKNPQEVKDYLRNEYFDLICRRIDYETIFGEKEEILDEIAFASPHIIEFINVLIEQSRTYDFSKIEHDIIGKIFERLIREEERHKLGQYFTRSDIVDLILNFCITTGKEVVLDPGCGSGTFLVKSYLRKKALLNKQHPELLEETWGIDIAHYPAHLSSLNLAIRDLRYEKNYPVIINKNFFEIVPERTRHKRRTSDGTEIITHVPKFDAVITNPPYTRHEEMEDLFKNMKRNAWNRVYKDWNYGISKRSSIYSYFFFHSASFLNQNGKLGFITNNSWLYSDYGKDLQWLFLNYFKIIAIIDSKVELWFPEAMVSTAITICELCGEEDLRNNNLVRFVYLKKKLPQINTKFEMNKLVDIFMKTNKFEENDQWRINPVKQEMLLNEASNEEREIKGANWGKYLEAPWIYYKILNKEKENICELSDFSRAKFGMKTGDNKFFIINDVTSTVDEKSIIKLFGMTRVQLLGEKIRIFKSGYGTLHLIEDEYLKPYVKSTVGFNKYCLTRKDLKDRILIVHEKRKNIESKKVYQYILFGESKGIHKKETCKARNPWFDLLPEIRSPIAYPERLRDRYLIFENKNNSYLNKTLYGIGDELSDENKYILLAILCSTIIGLFAEIQGRKPGGGGGPLDLDVKMVNSLMVPKLSTISKPTKEKLVSLYKKICKRDIGTIFEEVMKEDRQKLDEVVLICFGFNEKKEREKILMELYDEYTDLVKSRITKASSVRKSSSKKKVDIDLLAGQIIEEAKEEFGEMDNSENIFNKFNKLIKERTSNRKHHKELITIIWKELFGPEAKMPGETLELKFEE